MIDLNCHLLNHPRRGRDGLAEAAEVCRLASGEGVRTVVAAPPWDSLNPSRRQAAESYGRRLEGLRGEVGESPRLLLGFTLGFSPDLPAQLDEHGRSLTLNGGRHLLVSLPQLSLPAETEEVWGEVRRRGFEVVLARPECSPALRRDEGRLRRWVAGGAVLQLDAASVVGAYGREVQRCALRWADEFGGGVVLGSGGGTLRAGRHPVGAAREVLARKLGARRARAIASETPRAVVGGAGPVGPRPEQAGYGLALVLRRLKTTSEYLMRVF